MSYAFYAPGRLLFYCLQPAPVGGENLVADMDKVATHLRPAFLAKLYNEPIILPRIYLNGADIKTNHYPPMSTWQQAFDTKNKQTAEQQALQGGYCVNWLPDDLMQTSITLFQTIEHQGQQKLFTSLCENIDVKNINYSLAEGELKTHLEKLQFCWADHTPFLAEDVAIFNQAYENEELKIPLQAGEILLINNLACAHGREAYQGKREIYVSMGDPVERSRVIA